MQAKIITKRNCTIDKKQRVVSCDLRNGDKTSGSIKKNFLTRYGTISFSRKALLYIPQIQI